MRENKSRGFVTIATGSEYYYQLAANLLISYKKRGQGQYPFALICDRENGYSALFDDVILVEDYKKSTLDKLLCHSTSKRLRISRNNRIEPNIMCHSNHSRQMAIEQWFALEIKLHRMGCRLNLTKNSDKIIHRQLFTPTR